MISVQTESMKKSSSLLEVQGPERAQQLAAGTYQKLREGGFSDTDIMAFAGKLLALVASEVRGGDAGE